MNNYDEKINNICKIATENLSRFVKPNRRAKLVSIIPEAYKILYQSLHPDEENDSNESKHHIKHVIETAEYLAQMGLSPIVIAAGLMHHIENDFLCKRILAEIT